MRIYELPFDQFSIAHPLFHKMYYDEVFVDAAMEGKNPARLFVDHPTTPTAALLCRTYDFFPVGNPDSALREFIKDAPSEVGVFQEFYGYAVNDLWKNALLTDMPFLEVIPRENFRWHNAPVFNWREQLPDGVTIRRMDAALVEKAEREADFPFAQLFYGSTAAFLEHGFGFCLLENDHTASVVYTCTMSSKEASVGVDTVKPYQQKGYATRACAAFIEHCLQNKLIPTWDCDEWNNASIALAKKLGFVREQPFSELAMPNRQPLPLSTGRWHAEAEENKVILWSKT